MTEHHHRLIPHSAKTISRPRAAAKLAEAVERRLTLICAPPGYGKTVLASQFASTLEIPVVWQTIREYDRDLPDFYAQILVALKTIAPQIDSLPSPQNHPPLELAAQIAHYLQGVCFEPVLYVLDDVHQLDDAPDAAALLRGLVQLLPAAFHVLLVSRTIPSLPYVQMVARSQVLPIDQNDLRFNEQELHELAELLTGSDWAASDLRQLAVRLDGWPAGLRLALQPLPSELNAVALGGGGPEELFQKLAAEMMRIQAPGLYDFLLAASTLKHVTPESCLNILGLVASEQWLETAWSQSLFLSRTGRSFTFHKLFRESLQAQLKAQDPARFTALHCRAATWFEERDELELAFDHYLCAEDYQRAIWLAEQTARDLYGQARFETLLDWHAKLGFAGVISPWLAYTCSIILGERYDYERAELALQQAAPLGIRVDIQRAFLGQQRGHAREVLKQAEFLLDVPADSPHLRARALRAIGLAYLRLGDATQAVNCLEEAVDLYRKSGDASSLAHALLDLQLACWRVGKVDALGPCLQEAVNLRRALGGVGALGMALNNLGYYYHQSGEFEEALRIFEEALGAVCKVLDRRSESYLCWSLGDLYRDLGAWQPAINFYHRGLGLVSGHEPHLECALLISLSTLHRWQRRYDEARSLAEAAVSLANEHQIAFELGLAKAALEAMQSTLSGMQPEQVELGDLLAEFMTDTPPLEVLGSLALFAWRSLEQDKPSMAEGYLKQAVDLIPVVGTSQPLAAEVMHTPSLQTMLAECPQLQHPLLMARLEDLREAKSQLCPPDAEHTGGLFLPLNQAASSIEVFTLGQELILRNGEPVATSAWRGAQSREIFLYLLFHRTGTREDISAILWPDADEEQAAHYFHSALYQARRALGKDVILHETERYFLNAKIDIWCDAHQLERHVKRARVLPARDPHAEALWRRAAGLYQGRCLPSIGKEWAVRYRECFEAFYLDALVGMACCAQARQDSLGAVQYFKQALQVDPYREDIHRMMLNCLVTDLGQRALAREHYREIEQLFADELGVRPSTETESLARLLLV